MQFDELKPNWMKGLVRRNELSDEADLVQIGQQEEAYYYTYALG